MYHLKIGTLPYFKAVYLAVTMAICLLPFIKSWKNPWKGLLFLIDYEISADSQHLSPFHKYIEYDHLGERSPE